MTQKGNCKWEERHFQICLALIIGQSSKNSISNMPFKAIIQMADKMIELLVERERQGESNTVK